MKVMLQAAPLIYRDELTKLYTHRYFQEIFSQELVKAERSNMPLSLLLLDIDYFSHYNEIFGYPAGDSLLRQLGDFLAQKVGPSGIAARYGGEEFAVLFPGVGSKGALARANKLSNAIRNTGFPGGEAQPGGKVSVSIGVASYPEHAQDQGTLLQRAGEALLKAKTINKNKVAVYYSVFDHLKGSLSDLEFGLISAVKTLITIINAKDSYTYAHSERVLAYSQALGNKLGLNPGEMKVLSYGAYLHDIGKIEIPRDILNKRGTLTKKERRMVQHHSQWGADIIRPVKALEQAVPLVLYHHERYDGSGYPRGLKGEEIPLGARILALADSFDAMTSDRPYKKGMNLSQAIEEIHRCSGTQFDPVLAKMFTEILAKY